MSSTNISKMILFSILLFAGIACSESEKQLDFENRALSSPSGITEMSVIGDSVENGENDPDDWQTAPNFTGITGVNVKPAYPNPVSLNDTFELLVDIGGNDIVNGLQIFVFQQSGQMVGPIFQRSGPLEPGFLPIRINPQKFASSASTGNFGNIYRIILYDRQQTVITYGDVLVE